MGRPMKRAIFVIGGLVYIPLSNGLVATVDEEDLELVDGFNWSASQDKRTFCAHRRIAEGKLALHRVVMRAPAGVHVDHRDGDGLNCRRDNLRFATSSQNSMNRRLRSDNSLGLKGVYPSHLPGRFHAAITVAGVRQNLGTFFTAEDAAAAYRAASERLHGDFGRTQ